MKYLCLVYGEEQAISKMPDAHCVAFDEEVRQYFELDDFPKSAAIEKFRKLGVGE